MLNEKLFTACAYCSKKCYFKKTFFPFFEQYAQPANSQPGLVLISAQARLNLLRPWRIACALINTLRLGTEEEDFFFRKSYIKQFHEKRIAEKYNFRIICSAHKLHYVVYKEKQKKDLTQKIAYFPHFSVQLFVGSA